MELNAYVNKNQNYDKKYVRCFHCGENHYLYECERAKQRLPQTHKGALAWMEYARMRGISVVYDVEAWFKKFAGPRYEHIRNAQAVNDAQAVNAGRSRASSHSRSSRGGRGGSGGGRNKASGSGRGSSSSRASSRAAAAAAAVDSSSSSSAISLDE